MSFSARTGLQYAAPVVAVVLLSSCAPAGSRLSLTPHTSFTQFSQSQIEAVNAITAYDAVLRLRPTALNLAGGRFLWPTVYLDGLRMGGTEELNRIPAADIIGIEFLSPVEAMVRLGPNGRNGGAILLTTRGGRRLQPF